MVIYWKSVLSSIVSGAYVGVKTYVAKQDAEEAEADEEESQEIISIASDDVKSVKFVMDKKEVTFEKDGDSWVKSDETHVCLFLAYMSLFAFWNFIPIQLPYKESVKRKK